MKPSVLIVKRDVKSLTDCLNQEIGSKVQFYTATTGVEALQKYRVLRPMIIVIDDNLSDIRGQSVATIIKDTDMGGDTIIYVIGIKKLLSHAKANIFLCQNFDMKIFCYQLHADLIKKMDTHIPDAGLMKAIEIQNDMLPKPIQTTRFHVTGIFSAYSKLSGDGINYWYNPNDEKDMLYGYLFDCVGHDLSSYGQVGSLWLSLKKGMKFYQMGVHKTLSDVMCAINIDLVTLYDYVNIASALTFCFDFQQQVLRFCPAAIPCILIHKKGELHRTRIQCKSSRLGYEQDTKYQEQCIPLDTLDEVIFLSDGLSDLLLDDVEADEPFDIAKHDDVSAIFVTLK